MTTWQRRSRALRERGAEARQLLVAAHERRVEAPLGSDERGVRSSSLIPPARASSTARVTTAPAPPTTSPVATPAGRPSSRGGEHSAHGVVVRRRLGAEDRDEPFRAEPLEHAAVTVEHVAHRRERLVEPPAMLLRVVGGRRRRRQNCHQPELGGLTGGRVARALGRGGQLRVLSQYLPLELLQLR